MTVKYKKICLTFNILTVIIHTVKKLGGMFQMKKVLKIIAFITAIAGAAAAVYVILQKIKARDAHTGYDEENYVSCSCLEDEFTAETVA